MQGIEIPQQNGRRYWDVTQNQISRSIHSVTGAYVY